MTEQQELADAFRAHRRILIPVVGVLFTLAQQRRSRSPLAQRVLAQAIKWQGAGAAIVLMHAGLQVFVELVRWMVAVGPGVPPPLDRLVDPMLLILTLLNLASGLVEYGFVTFWGLRAERRQELPMVRGAGGARSGQR